MKASCSAVACLSGRLRAEFRLRENTGTHCTPRVLAEEVVLHALGSLVYEPDPLQMADAGEWRLKSKARLLV
ncbi:uncharacterized protein SAZU_5471 [Streptomyces azureus]|uniref:Uncharacterized protein n=1 Tax=Streptomyces azureus TaxID=146537 RepID=A0A0K8PSA5_STRAJ|nr:uncharacterized protein SAZU_5471 [Streptomyces azureus]